MQNQTLNTLYNAIMEAGGKDRTPMLALGNYVQWKSRIKRYINTKPNHELIHYCLKNTPYEYTWADKAVPVTEGSSEATTERYMENYKNVSQDIRDQLNAKAEAVQDKEIDKHMALIFLSFKKIYKPTNDNLRTSSNSSRANQDNSLRINRGAGYDNQRIVNVDGARETVGVIPTTSVSRPQLKSNQMEDRVMLNNSQEKKPKVEDHCRNVKFSKNKTSITLCNDSLNAKTSNVNFVCATCGKYVLNEKHDVCVLKSLNGVNSRTKMPMDVPISTGEPKLIVNQSVAKPLRRTVASESNNQKPRHITRKLYEHVSKACSWWYPKFTPPGYKWKPKSQIGNVNPNVSMPLRNASRIANILEPMTNRRSIMSNTTLYSNYFAARRDNPIHRRLWVLKAHDGKSQASN
nr:hypothetical protein [Tanacetum cinerariifolium]